MLLWDIIRDWFVQFVFGGNTSSGEEFGGSIGYGWLNSGDANIEGDPLFSSGRLGVVLSGFSDSYTGYVDEANHVTSGDLVLSLGDWLSTTATIITLIALCLFLFLAVKWVFNVFRNTLERVGK